MRKKNNFRMIIEEVDEVRAEYKQHPTNKAKTFNQCNGRYTFDCTLDDR